MGRPRIDYPKTCQWCGSTMYRRPKEGTTWWAKRKYCSKPARCIYEAQRTPSAEIDYTVEELEFLTQPGFPPVPLDAAARRLKWSSPRMLEAALREHNRTDLLAKLRVGEGGHE